mgnify:CR=1 FL=1
MTEWKRDAAKYTFKDADSGVTTRAYVYGAMDPSDQNRAQLILENQPENTGHSLETQEGQATCIQGLSQDMGIKSTDADWFVRDDAGSIRALDVMALEETIPNRQFQEYQNKGEFSIHELEEARKSFPDETLARTEVAQRAPTEGEVERLEEAFGPDGPAYFEAEATEPTHDQSAHEINLADESFRP